MTTSRARILLTGVGGQGTLTATTLLATCALHKGLQVTSGEIHGMAQRGGVVESTVLLGGYKSPRIAPGEADVLLGFEPLETYRALSILKPGAVVISNSETVDPIGVTLGRETYPDLDAIRQAVEACAGTARFVPCRSLARQAGTELAANIVLLGALCGLGVLDLSLDDLKATIKRQMKPKIVDVNIAAATLGAEAAAA